jgi:hypothetical protein
MDKGENFHGSIQMLKMLRMELNPCEVPLIGLRQGGADSPQIASLHKKLEPTKGIPYIPKQSDQSRLQLNHKKKAVFFSYLFVSMKGRKV